MRTNRTLLALATALLCLTGTAQAQNAAPSTHERLLAWADKRGADDLKDIYLRCAAFSSRTRMDQDAAALCSTVSEILMKRSFEGDFNALIAWWKAQPEPTDFSIAAEMLDASRFMKAEPQQKI